MKIVNNFLDMMGFENTQDFLGISLNPKILGLVSISFGTIASQGTGNSYFAGNVGIGITSPLNPLSIESDSSPLIKIRNTTNGGGVAVLVSSVIRADDSNFTTGWQVTNNTINGYPTGLQIAGNGTIVNFNTITNYTQYGLYIRDRADDISVSNSSFTTSESGTTALYNFPAGITVDNADIVNCTFTGQQYGFNLLNISGSLSDDLNIDNCDFVGATKLQDVSNTTIQNSTYQTPINESGTNNVTYINNNP